MSITFLEIGTHPDDLLIQCAEAKDYPGKFVTNFYRGIGHRYKPLLTCDKVEALADGREAAIARVRNVLGVVALVTLHMGSAPKTLEDYVSLVRKAGFDSDWFTNERLEDDYKNYSRSSLADLLPSMIDVNRVMNAAMINEIIERLQTCDEVDTSQDKLLSFVGSPTC